MYVCPYIPNLNREPISSVNCAAPNRRCGALTPQKEQQHIVRVGGITCLCKRQCASVNHVLPCQHASGMGLLPLLLFCGGCSLRHRSPLADAYLLGQGGRCTQRCVRLWSTAVARTVFVGARDVTGNLGKRSIQSWSLAKQGRKRISLALQVAYTMYTYSICFIY